MSYDVLKHANRDELLGLRIDHIMMLMRLLGRGRTMCRVIMQMRNRSVNPRSSLLRASLAILKVFRMSHSTSARCELVSIALICSTHSQRKQVKTEAHKKRLMEVKAKADAEAKRTPAAEAQAKAEAEAKACAEAEARANRNAWRERER